MTNKLFYGDNLHVLRQHIEDESVDLIYLDPPFNSNANYNILFKSPKGMSSDSQIEAFEDTWHYGEQAAQAFHEVMTSGNTDVANLLRAMQAFLGQNDMMAYLAMMAARLIELHRVLKPMGSLYLHCDPTASHYLKLLLDGVFGAERFVNEVIWKRSHAHSDSRQGARHFGRLTDTILFYSKTADRTWNPLFAPYDQKYLDRDYRRLDSDGRRYRLDNIQGPGGAAKGNPSYELMGVTRYWRYSRTRMDELVAAGRIVQTRPGAVPQYKRYLDEMPGVPLQNIWDDISIINNRSKELMGYPTQKPVSLLERILSASSNPGDVVLDPFCGCGTAVHAAQKLGRQWIGIDVTYLAIGLIERRLQEAFPGIAFEIVGEPRGRMDAEHLAASEPHQFQYWITQKIGGQPYQGGRKGADRGIDGYVYYTRNDPASAKSSTAAAIISVKAGRNVGPAMIRDLVGVIDREKADLGIFVCVAPPTREMQKEAASAGIWTDRVTGVGYRRVQIFTLEDLFAGRMPKMPLLDRQAGYRRARTETSAVQQRLL